MSARRVQLHVDQIYEGLFDPVIKDISTRKFQYERIYEQSSSVTKAPLAANTQLNFLMTNTARWFLPSQSYIYIQANVVDISGGAPANLANTSTLALQNNFPIFNNVNYLINNVAVEQQAQFFGVKHLIKNLLDYSDDNGNSYQDECWIRDTGAGLTDPAPALVAGANFGAAYTTPNPAFNAGYVKRRQIIAGSRNFTLRIPLWRMFDFLGKDVVYTGAPHTLTLFINSNLSQLYIKNAVVAPGGAADGTLPQMNIVNIFWEVPYVDPSPQVGAAILEKMAKTKSASWIFPYSTVYQFPVTANTPSVQWPIATLTERPYQVVVFIQSTAAIQNANLQQNVQTFFNAAPGAAGDISNIYLTWGGDSYPQYQYRPSQIAGYGPGEAYATYLQLNNRYFDTEGGASINFADFQSLYTIYTFDMRYTGEDENPFAAGQNSQLNLSIAFINSLAAGNTIWAVVYSEREANVNFADGKTLLTTK